MTTPEDRVERAWANVTFGPGWEDRLSALMVKEIKGAVMQAATSNSKILREFSDEQIHEEAARRRWIFDRPE